MLDIKKGRREGGRKTEAGAGNGGGYGRTLKISPKSKELRTFQIESLLSAK